MLIFKCRSTCGPQTVFEITSTLYGSSDIGRFYAPIDNVAMREAVGRAAEPPSPVPGSSGAPVPPPPPGPVPRFSNKHSEQLFVSIALLLGLQRAAHATHTLRTGSGGNCIQ